MNFYQAAVLVTLVGIVLSAPLPVKLDIMEKDTIENALSLISRIQQEVPKTHKSWISIDSLTLGSGSDNLHYLKNHLNISYAPVLKTISNNFTLETCLARIVEGLKLHLTLLKVVSNTTTLPKTEQGDGLKADIRELLFQIHQMQSQMGFELSKHDQQATKERLQTLEDNVASRLTDEYMTQVAAHLTLEQLEHFSHDVERSLHSMSSSTQES